MTSVEYIRLGFRLGFLSKASGMFNSLVEQLLPFDYHKSQDQAGWLFVNYIKWDDPVFNDGRTWWEHPRLRG